jgi:hypothetical protein
LSRKMKNDASKTLGKQTKKHHDTLEFYKMNIGSTCNNLQVGWATFIGFSLVLFCHPPTKGPKPLLIRSDANM